MGQSTRIHSLRILHVATAVVIQILGWMGSAAGQDFTDEEKAWLATKPVLRVGVDPNWPPYSIVDSNGTMTGIDRDILDLITQRTGIRFQIVTGASWSAVEQLAREGKVDLLCGTAHSTNRATFARFTQSYVPSVVAIITRKDGDLLTTLAHLEGRTVAVPRDHIGTQALAADYPGIRLLLTDNLSEALRMVDEGKADATIGNLMGANYSILKDGLRNLIIAGVTDYTFDIHYAVIAEGPALGVLDKTIAELMNRKIPEIIDRWTGVDFQRSVSTRNFRNVLLWTVGIAAGIILLIVAWSRSLTRELAERRRVEKELSRANEALVSAAEEKSALMRMLAHDLNSPLAVLTMLSNYFQRRASSDPEAVNEVRMMQGSVDKMARLIRKLLNADALEHGKQKLTLRDWNPVATVRAVTGRLQATAAAKQISLVFQEQQSCSARADELALDQIVENLVSNAIKFTPIGGRVEVSVVPTDGVVEIRVADNGPGVSDAEQPLLFKKFSRLSPRPTAGESSYGLGLMLTRRLAGAMEASVDYERLQPIGSMFTVKLKPSVHMP